MGKSIYVFEVAFSDFKIYRKTVMLDSGTLNPGKIYLQIDQPLKEVVKMGECTTIVNKIAPPA
ncbi:MAG: hypothetical protein ACMUEM_02675 [Flavobacteriales bacterium AspAUS03]